MAEGQGCCCWSNRGWLLFLVALRIIGCIVGIFAGIHGIVVISKLDGGSDPELAALLQRVYIELWVVLVASVIILLVNLLPIVAEMKKKPKLLLAFRNWTILILIFEIVQMCLLIAEVGFTTNVAVADEPGIPIGQQIGALIVVILTLVLVQRRMKELQEEIGETSFLKFV